MLRKIIVPLTFIALLLISSIVCASSQINSDSQIVKDGIKTAETYWNAQKKSDEVLFHSVTPHDSMDIVFDWSFVNRSDVLVEESPIKNIKSDLQKFFEHYNKFKKIQEKIQSDEQNFFANHNKFENMPEYSNTPITELEAATIYATNIEKGCCPILGDLLKKAFWSTIIPNNFIELKKYRLMTLKYIADVKMQSINGFVLKKRATLHLYRMQADSNDSGWKVFYVTGLHN